MSDTPAEGLATLQLRFVAVSQPLNDRVLSEPQGKEFSYANTLLCLSSEAMRTFLFLFQAYSSRQVQQASWAARNLLELSIWCEYCSQSITNAQRFYQDTLRDILGIVTEFELLARHAPTPISAEHVSDAKKSLEVLAGRAGMTGLDDDFTRVHAAAKELGPTQQAAFRHTNVILSKIVHPTAFIVNMVFDTEFSEKLLELSYLLGRTFADACFNEIEKARL
jgi:hypothetical protein